MSSHRRCATKDGLVAGTALRLQPPMWDTPRKRTAPWEDILAQRLALLVRPPLCDSLRRPAVIGASIQWTSQQEGHHKLNLFSYVSPVALHPQVSFSQPPIAVRKTTFPFQTALSPPGRQYPNATVPESHSLKSFLRHGSCTRPRPKDPEDDAPQSAALREPHERMNQPQHGSVWLPPLYPEQRWVRSLYIKPARFCPHNLCQLLLV